MNALAARTLAPDKLAQRLDELQLTIDNATRAIARVALDPEVRLLKRAHPFARTYYARRDVAERERRVYLDELDRRCRALASRYTGRWDVLSLGERARLMRVLRHAWNEELTP